MSPDPIRSRFPPRDDADRSALLKFAREAPLVYGPWAAFKALYKWAEAEGSDPELLGTLIGRLDAASLAETAAGRSGPSIGLPRMLAAAGDLLCVVAGFPEVLHVLDVSTPAQPKAVGKIETAPVWSLAVQDRFAYVGSGHFSRRELNVVDLADPAAPRTVGSLELKAGRQLVAAGRLLLALTGGTAGQAEALAVVDIGDPAAPRLLAEREVSAARAVATAGTVACVCQRGAGFKWGSLPSKGGVRFFDLANPGQPRELGKLDVGNAQAAALAGNFAYVLVEGGRRGRVGLRVLDVGNPARPKQVGALEWQGTSYRVEEGARWNVLHRGSHLLATDGSHGFWTIDVADPAHPKLASEGDFHTSAFAALGDALFTAFGWAGIRTLGIQSPGRPVAMDEIPSPATRAYMKRRARRFMRRLATRDPELFVRTAYHALRTSGRRRQAVDPATHWVSMDLLYGGGRRWAQGRHGRGTYQPLDTRPRLRTREERLPEAWDRHPDLARQLYEASLPWQTREAALKMLRAARQRLPVVDDRALAAFLASDSLLLKGLAEREMTPLILAGLETKGKVAADAFFCASAANRLRLDGYLTAQERDVRWEHEFADRLQERIAEALSASGATPRAGHAAALLAERYAQHVGGRGYLALGIALLAARRREWAALAAETLRAAPISDMDWLAALEPLPAAQRERALSNYLEQRPRRALDLTTATMMVSHHSVWLREAAWRLVREAASPEVISRLWAGLLAGPPESPALRAALASPAALSLLQLSMAGEGGAAVAAGGALIEALPDEALAMMVGALPAEGLVGLAQSAGDAQWPRVREPLLQALETPEGRDGFWRAVWDRLPGDETGRLRERLLEDDALAGTFLALEDLVFLEDPDPAAGPLLLRWVRRQESRFARDSEALLAAATTPAAEPRAWALARVGELGMSLPFALRLMEAGLPDADAAGRRFFEAIPESDPAALEGALALCDSPASAVRAFGREYVRARWEALPRAELARALAEHADPRMQEFVARFLLEAPEMVERAPEFDRSVLRTRQRGRRAKELVKARLETSPAPDLPTLLELARGQTASDREWALQQIARLVAAGVEIEGVTVEVN